jgi:adenylate cyclase
MPPDEPADTLAQLHLTAFDDALGRNIVDTHIWAVREGLRGADAHHLFDGYCQRLVISGTPLWRAHVAMETLHPQWSGYGYVWRRDLNAIEPEQYAHDSLEQADWLNSPLNHLIVRGQAGEENPWMRRRLEQGPDQRDFPILREFFAKGATDYVAYTLAFGKDEDIRSRPTVEAVSVTTIRRSCRRRCPGYHLRLRRTRATSSLPDC